MPDGHILMMMRRGMWDLPKGHLEPGETLRGCAAREVCEECGLDPRLLEVGEPIARTTHTYTNEKTDRLEEKHTTWFAMRYTGDPAAATPQTSEDISALHWLTPAQARQAAATSYQTIQQVLFNIS